MKLGVIGCGKMAEAIIRGVIESGLHRSGEICGSDINRRKLGRLAKKTGILACSSNAEVILKSGVTVLAVKPQDISKVVSELRAAKARSRLVISIAAGVRICTIQQAIRNARVIRVMPNMPCLVGGGMSVFAAGSRATTADCRVAQRLFNCLGDVLQLSEKQLDAVTALSGSGPAFLAYCLDSMIDGAVREGLSRRIALKLATQTMFGTGKLLRELGTDPADLIAAVASAKGTTAAGLTVLESSCLRQALVRTIRAAAKRSRNLSGVGNP